MKSRFFFHKKIMNFIKNSITYKEKINIQNVITPKHKKENILHIAECLLINLNHKIMDRLSF